MRWSRRGCACWQRLGRPSAADPGAQRPTGARSRPGHAADPGTQPTRARSRPRPDPDSPAPPRFLPEYDNVLLSYADRRRVIPHARQPPLWPGNGATQGTVLIDGLWNALWEITRKDAGTRKDRSAVLTVTPFRALTAPEEADLAEEGARLLAFTSPGQVPDVRFAPRP